MSESQRTEYTPKVQLVADYIRLLGGFTGAEAQQVAEMILSEAKGQRQASEVNGSAHGK